MLLSANIQNVSILGESQPAVKWQNLRPVKEIVDSVSFTTMLAEAIASGPTDTCFPVLQPKVPSMQRRAAHEQSLRQLTLKNLKDRAKEYGLVQRGDTNALVKRILDYLDQRDV